MKSRLLVAIAALAAFTAACSEETPAGQVTSTTTEETSPTTQAPVEATTTAAPADTTETTSTTSTTTTTTTTTTLPPDPLQGLDLELVADGLTRPTALAAAPGDERIFVADARGRLWTVEPGAGLAGEPYLDISDRVINGGIEQGLLGVAFHPDFEANGRLFAYYVDEDDDVHVAEFAGGPDAASPESEKPILFIERTQDRHYGGMLEFGPDGFLYVSVGDAATGGEHGQDTTTLNGTILRLDVDSATPYAIPETNPFADGGGAAEIWAYGLRNPWRFDIDPVERLMFIGDVGQTRYEEVDVVSLDSPGANFGWSDMEGAHCFGVTGCDPADYTGPVVEYGREGGSCSVTGGVVYRGSAIPELTGTYFYGDWCGGWTRSFVFREGVASEQMDWTDDLGTYGQPNTFGTDADGEVLVATWDGEIYRIVPIR
jgi:glucose/arabinose dehydrogenase